MVRQITCYYHPDVVANATCDRCHRPICLNDVKKYQRRRREYHGDDVEVYVERYTFCPPCYYERIESDNSVAARAFQLVIAGLAVVFIFVVMSMFSSAFSMFSVMPSGMMDGLGIGFFGIFALIFIAIPLIVIVVILYNVLVASPSRVKEARAEKEAFFASLSNARQVGPSPLSTSTSTFQMPAMTCFECGTPLKITDKFCPNCGDPTTEERAALGQ